MTHRWSFWMSPIEHRGIRFLDDLYRGWLTPFGQVFVWAAVATGLLQRGNVSELLVISFGFCAGALATAFILGLPFRPNVQLARHLPSSPSMGETLRYSVTVRNVGRRTARQIVVQERNLPADLRPVGEPPVIAALRPGESASVTLFLDCKSRGAFVLNRLQAASIFPAALWKWPRRSREAHTVLVFPKITRLDRFEIPLGSRYQPGGMSSASRIGESTEFLGTRDWRHGDRLRDLHWPSFARTGRPIVKEFQEEYFVRVALVIDTEVRNAKQEVLFEKGLSFIAGAAHALAKAEAIIDIFAAGSEVHRFQAGRALAHFENILELLACLDAEHELDVPVLEAALIPEAAQLSAVLLMLNVWEPRRAALVEKLRASGVAVRVLLLTPPETPTGLGVDELVVLP